MVAVLSLKEVSDALSNLKGSGKRKETPVLESFLWVDNYLSDPRHRISTENIRDFAVDEMIYSVTLSAYNQVRKAHNLSNLSSSVNLTNLKQYLNQDFAQPTTLLYGMSLVYYAYVDAHIDLSLTELYAIAGISERTGRRYLQQGIKHIQKELIRLDHQVTTNKRKLHLKHNLPYMPITLIGRDTETNQLLQKLENNAHIKIAIVGVKKIGKTSYVGNTLREWVDTSENLPEVIYWIADKEYKGIETPIAYHSCIVIDNFDFNKTKTVLNRYKNAILIVIGEDPIYDRSSLVHFDYVIRLDNLDKDDALQLLSLHLKESYHRNYMLRLVQKAKFSPYHIRLLAENINGHYQPLSSDKRTLFWIATHSQHVGLMDLIHHLPELANENMIENMLVDKYLQFDDKQNSVVCAVDWPSHWETPDLTWLFRRIVQKRDLTLFHNVFAHILDVLLKYDAVSIEDYDNDITKTWVRWLIVASVDTSLETVSQLVQTAYDTALRYAIFPYIDILYLMPLVIQGKVDAVHYILENITASECDDFLLNASIVQFRSMLYRKNKEYLKSIELIEKNLKSTPASVDERFLFIIERMQIALDLDDTTTVQDYVQILKDTRLPGRSMDKVDLAKAQALVINEEKVQSIHLMNKLCQSKFVSTRIRAHMLYGQSKYLEGSYDQAIQHYHLANELIAVNMMSHPDLEARLASNLCACYIGLGSKSDAMHYLDMAQRRLRIENPISDLHLAHLSKWVDLM